jgi:hypothetical protein
MWRISSDKHPQLWPEGDTFIREVLIPTKYEPLPVLVTYIVPPFDAVVATWQNTDPERRTHYFDSSLLTGISRTSSLMTF